MLTKPKTLKLNQSLTCADFGIYVATCVMCHEQYVGQTSNKFSKRWSAHRSNWNKQGSDGLVAALFREPRHYKQATSTRNIHRYFCRTTNQVVTLWTSVKINGITWLKRKTTVRTWSSPMWNNHYDALCCLTKSDVVFYGAPFEKILYLTDLAQKLLSLRAFSYEGCIRSYI